MKCLLSNCRLNSLLSLSIFSVISDVAFTSVHSEKTGMKKLMMIIIMKNRKKLLFLLPETEFCHVTETKKVMEHFQFDALYR